MADYFYASYHFDVPLPPRPEQVETSTTQPWRARLACYWTMWPEIRQRLQKRLLEASVRVFSDKGIVSRVGMKQKRVPGDKGLYLWSGDSRGPGLKSHLQHTDQRIQDRLKA